jgi:hypothetical protein
MRALANRIAIESVIRMPARTKLSVKVLDEELVTFNKNFG